MDINSLFGRSSQASSSSRNLMNFQRDMVTAQAQLQQQVARLNYQKQVEMTNAAALQARMAEAAAVGAQFNNMSQRLQTIQDIVDVFKVQNDLSLYNQGQMMNSLFELNRVAEVNNKRLTQDLRTSTGEVRVSFGATNIVADTGSAKNMIDQLGRTADVSAQDAFRQISSQKQQVMANITNEFVNNEYARIEANKQAAKVYRAPITGTTKMQFLGLAGLGSPVLDEISVDTSSLVSRYEN